MVLRVAPIWLIFSLCTCILFFLVLVATARRHGRRARSTTGRFEAAQCANPTHGVLKSGPYAELRFVRPAFLRAVRGHTSRRKKICAVCIEKLWRKSEFRDLFCHKVGPCSDLRVFHAVFVATWTLKFTPAPTPNPTCTSSSSGLLLSDRPTQLHHHHNLWLPRVSERQPWPQPKTQAAHHRHLLNQYHHCRSKWTTYVLLWYTSSVALQVLKQAWNVL